jgi:hypothetical protein
LDKFKDSKRRGRIIIIIKKKIILRNGAKTISLQTSLADLIRKQLYNIYKMRERVTFFQP